MPRVYGYLEGRYHHDVVFLSRAKTGHGMTIFAQFPRGVMSKGEISADLLCEERRLHKLAAQTYAASGEPSSVVVDVELLSDPRWDVVASSPRRPLADAAARDAVPASAIELIERRRAVELKSAEFESMPSGDLALLDSDTDGWEEGAGTGAGGGGVVADMPRGTSAPRPSACSCTGLSCGCGYYI